MGINLRELTKIALEEDANHTVSGEVIEVNESEMICTVVPNDGGAEYFNVMLRALNDEKDTGVILIPKLNSQVLIAAVDNDDDTRFVTKTSEIEKIYIKGEFAEIVLNIENEDGVSMSIKTLNQDIEKEANMNIGDNLSISVGKDIAISAENIKLNNGGNGGVPIAQEIANSLNTIVNFINSFVFKYNAHVHPNHGVITPTTMSQQLSQFSSTSLENTKVKH